MRFTLEISDQDPVGITKERLIEMADAAPDDEDAGPSHRSALKLFGSAWRDYMEKEIGSGRHSADTLEALASVFALLTSLACTRAVAAGEEVSAEQFRGLPADMGERFNQYLAETTPAVGFRTDEERQQSLNSHRRGDRR